MARQIYLLTIIFCIGTKASLGSECAKKNIFNDILTKKIPFQLIVLKFPCYFIANCIDHTFIWDMSSWYTLSCILVHLCFTFLQGLVLVYHCPQHNYLNFYEGLCGSHLQEYIKSNCSIWETKYLS